MRLLNVMLGGLVLLGATFSAAASATDVLIDGFEDTNYGVYTSVAGESVALASNASHTQGASSLQVTYNYVAGGQWTKTMSVQKTLSPPVDLSGAVKVRFDLTVPAADQALTLILVLADTAGNESRIVMTGALHAAVTNKTFAYAMSDFSKTQWATGGRAFNLKEVARVDFRIQNNDDIAAAGSNVMRIDNLRVENNAHLLSGDVADNFDAYADTAAMQAVWQPASPSTSVARVSDDAGGNALQVQADISGRWINYWAARTLPAETDLRGMTHLRLRLKGDSRLASYSPTAKVFLEDASGNRALAYINFWAGVDRWSEIYLPLQGDGIEPLTGAGVGAFGGASSWREDLYDVGGQAGNIDLQHVTRIGLGIETQGTGAYPLTGINLLFDEVVFGYPPRMDTPPALSLALESASAGALLPLGISSTEFGAGLFLNQGHTRLNDVAGTLVYSDDPETVVTPGILYRTPVPVGVVRTIIYHVNDALPSGKVTATVRNMGTSTAHIVFLRKSLPSPSTDYITVGREGVRRYYENSTMPPSLTLAPGQTALLDGTMDSLVVLRYRLFHSIHDFTTDQPLEITSLLLSSSANTLAVLGSTAFSPDDTYRREGTFATLGRENVAPLEYDTANGIGRVRMAGWDNYIDPFFEGTDAEDGQPSRLLGNYGGTYKIRLQLTASDGRSVAVVQVPPDGSCGYAGYLRWEAPDTGGVGVGQFAPATGAAAPGQGGIVCKLNPGGNPLTLRMDTIPAGSMCLPVDFLLIPYGTASADVAGWELY